MPSSLVEACRLLLVLSLSVQVEGNAVVAGGGEGVLLAEHLETDG
jgi:hypothetical protein